MSVGTAPTWAFALVFAALLLGLFSLAADLACSGDFRRYRGQLCPCWLAVSSVDNRKEAIVEQPVTPARIAVNEAGTFAGVDDLIARLR
jgi:hypothetical protein